MKIEHKEPVPGRQNLTKLMKAIESMEGKARTRLLGSVDYEDFCKLCADNPDKKYIAVYSSDGFVPNSYRGKALISRITRSINDDGVYVFSVERASANRSHGAQSTRIVK